MTQPHAPQDRLRAGDAALVEQLGLSVNEAHALALGLSIGVLTRRAGRPSIALGVAVWSLLGSGGAIGARTLRREPWYGLAGIVAGVLFTSWVRGDRFEAGEQTVALAGGS